MSAVRLTRTFGARPGRLGEARPVEKDDAIADIGAGTGYFSFRVAERVPNGVAYAVDIQQEMLAEIERRKRGHGIGNIETLLGRIVDPGLGEKSTDLILIADAYHEFSHPREMGEAILRQQHFLVFQKHASP